MGQAKEEEQAGSVTPELQKDIEAWRRKAVSLKSRRKRDDWARYLVAQTGFTEKATNHTTPLSQEEESRRLQAGWQWWDFMIWLAGGADSTALSRWVAQAEQFVLSRGETVLIFSDQIPIWLCPQAGKVLVRQSLVHQAAAYKRAKEKQPVRQVFQHRQVSQNRMCVGQALPRQPGGGSLWWPGRPSQVGSRAAQKSQMDRCLSAGWLARQGGAAAVVAAAVSSSSSSSG